MSVYEIAMTAVPAMQNVLLWDTVEREWRIGHLRSVIEGVAAYYCGVPVAEANDLLSDDYPVPVFTDVSHWARLPSEPEG